MNKLKNWGMGMSVTDPVRYRKINDVLKDRQLKPDLLDVVETIPIEYAYGVSSNVTSPEDAMISTELNESIAKVLSTLTAREERVLRRRFGIGLKTDATLEKIGQEFSLSRDRIRQIEAKAMRKLKHPSVSRTVRFFLEAA
jgi:RNA polymerase sigma factor (sigma-70 family)|tara:strand:+ start:120 stop:542 length:423 start_codon:yes stop_codon:yes gene_type:complete